MRMRGFAITLLLCFLAVPPVAWARWVWTEGTGLINTEDYELGDPEALYEHARQAFEAGEYGEAATEFTIIATWSHSPVFREKAMFMRAESFSCEGEYDPAYEAYEEYRVTFPHTPRLKHILRRELDIGLKFMEGAKRRLPLVPLSILPARDFGKQLMRRILRRYPYEEFSEEYQYLLAARLLENGELEEARKEFEHLRRSYPSGGGWEATAQFQIALSYLRQYLGPDYDGTPLLKARREFQTYLDENPEGDLVEEAHRHLVELRRLRHEKDFGQAEYWIRRARPHSAMLYLEGILKEQPEPDMAEKARALFEQLEVEYGPGTIPLPDRTEADSVE